MFETNVLGTLHVFQALLPALRASGTGLVVNIGSTAGHVSYEGGAGYTAAKHGVKTLTETLRLEHVSEPLRFTEIAPGIAVAVAWVATRPAHVDVDLMVLRPRAQAAQHKVHREG